MGNIKQVGPVKYIAGLLLSAEESFEPICRELLPLLGPVDWNSPVVPFDYTDYYREEMGELFRTYVAFGPLRSPEDLARVKVATNEVEDRFRNTAGNRTVNIDPGYLSSSQLVLASTKPFSHRIYLTRGIYAEVTLLFKQGSFSPLPWTYADYRANIPLFNDWKSRFREQLKSSHFEQE